MNAQLETPEQYASDLSACKTLDELRACMGKYSYLATDAAPIVSAMTEADFQVFVRGLKYERRGKFAGEKWAKQFAAVLMPEPMFTVARLANEYKAPFDVTLRRIKEVRPDILSVPR